MQARLWKARLCPATAVAQRESPCPLGWRTGAAARAKARRSRPGRVWQSRADRSSSVRPDGRACCGVRCTGRRRRRRRRRRSARVEPDPGVWMRRKRRSKRERSVTVTLVRQVRARATAPRCRGARQVARGPAGAQKSPAAISIPSNAPHAVPCVGAPASAMFVAPSGSATKERATGKQRPSICPSAPPSPDSRKSAGWQPPRPWAVNFASAHTSTGS